MSSQGPAALPPAVRMASGGRPLPLVDHTATPPARASKHPLVTFSYRNSGP